MNAKQEMLELLRGSAIKCAEITHSDNDKKFNLPLNHTSEQFKNWLNSLDFEYDDGYGGQELFGTVWFTNNIWASRSEYDGSEWWKVNEIPDIPIELIK